MGLLRKLNFTLHQFLFSLRMIANHPEQHRSYANILQMNKLRLRFTQHWCALEEALKPSDSWTLTAKTIQKSPGDTPSTTYLQFWWDPRVALLSFGAVLSSFPSWPQVTFVSFLTFGPFMASGSVIAVVPMISLNNQTS